MLDVKVGKEIGPSAQKAEGPFLFPEGDFI
jgi:hypothetical protein